VPAEGGKILFQQVGEFSGGEMPRRAWVERPVVQAGVNLTLEGLGVKDLQTGELCRMPLKRYHQLFMTAIKDVAKWHPVPLYFALTIVISWGAILILAGPEGIPASAEQAIVFGMAMLLGPTIASILLIGLVSGRVGFRELLSRLLRWRVGIRWYAVALVTAPLSTASVLLVLSLLSPEFTPSILIANDKVALILTGIVAGITVGLLEELGWTGFATPQMRRRHGFLHTGLTIGALWGAWHFLLFWESDSFSGAFPLVLLLARLFSWAPAYRIVMVWVYDHTESLLITTLMHVTLVATLVIMEPPLTGGALLTYILVRAAVLWGMVAAIALAQRRVARVKWS
jgi:uncharacterized protein